MLIKPESSLGSGVVIDTILHDLLLLVLSDLQSGGIVAIASALRQGIDCLGDIRINRRVIDLVVGNLVGDGAAHLDLSGLDALLELPGTVRFMGRDESHCRRHRAVGELVGIRQCGAGLARKLGLTDVTISTSSPFSGTKCNPRSAPA